MRAALKENTREDGWCTLGWLGKTLKRLDPDFDTKDYGQSTLTEVLRKTGSIEIKEAEGELTLLRFAPPKP